MPIKEVNNRFKKGDLFISKIDPNQDLIGIITRVYIAKKYVDYEFKLLKGRYTIDWFTETSMFAHRTKNLGKASKLCRLFYL